MDWIKWALVSVFVPVILVATASCAQPRKILKSEGPTMRDLIEGGRRIDTGPALSRPGAHPGARHGIRRPEALRDESLLAMTELQSYTRDALNETKQLFARLENPEIAIYVYPHLATDRRMPVPGYTTALPLYERYEYALPGEIGR